MARKYNSDEYIPKNPSKYVGSKIPRYKSSWELSCFRVFDNHSSILEWAYEPIKIPYLNPLSNKMSVYVPDFLIRYVDKKGKIRSELVEVKPKAESFFEHAKTKKNKTALIVNAAKWENANKWAKKHGISFRIVTEDQLFGRPKK